MIQRIRRRLRREFRRFIGRGIPTRAVILLTNPRSGSTWLFDALRCHPAIYVHRDADLWQWLGLHGRRYPRDLSGDPKIAIEVEVLPGRREWLPQFQLPAALNVAARGLNRYAVEKCHPHFFDHEVDRFVGQVKALDARGAARMVYQMRDPRTAIVSFLRYKDRNPAWNKHIAPDQVIAHMGRIYETLATTAAQYPGIIIDYADLEADMQAALRRIFTWLWPEQPQAADDSLIAAIVTATKRGKRAATTFLGTHTSSADDATYAPLFDAHANDLERCYAAYNRLRQLAQQEHPA